MSARVATAVEPDSRDEDRVAVFPVLDARVLVLADGAGGRAGGAEAADGLIRRVGDRARALVSGAVHPAELLREVDATLAADPAAGETTAVVPVVSAGTVRGASVGDSGAWLVSPGGVRDLTRSRIRKPMVGSGSACPVAFGPAALEGRLLLASDGLLEYAPPERILAAALPPHGLEQAARALIETVRYPSGALPDDVAVILCEVFP